MRTWMFEWSRALKTKEKVYDSTRLASIVSITSVSITPIPRESIVLRHVADGRR